MAAKKDKELVPAPSGFMASVNADISALLAEELEGLDLTFERIKVPSAGSTVFEVPGENPSEPDTVKEFSAVVLHQHPLFAFYQSAYTGGNNPPDCGTFDGLKGVGTPGGNCKTCPNNQWGTAENGGKLCKNRRRIYLLREGELFPMLLSLPTGSLKGWQKYLITAIGKYGHYNKIVTRFSLKKAVNAGGIAYSQAQFEIDRLLTQDEAAGMERLSLQIKAMSESVAFEYDNVVSDPSSDVPPIDPETGEIIAPLA